MSTFREDVAVDDKKENQQQQSDTTTNQQSTQNSEQQVQDQNQPGDDTAEDTFDWNNLLSSDDTEADDSTDNTIEKQDNSDDAETQTADDKQQQGTSENAGDPVVPWKQVAEKAGITAETEEEFVAEVNKLRKATPQTQYVRTGDEVLLKLGEMLRMTKEDRVAQELRYQGFTEEQIVKRLKHLKDTDQLDFENDRITNGIKNAINKRQGDIEKAKKAKLKEDEALQTNFTNSVEKYVNTLDSILGVSMGKDDAVKAKTRKQMVKDLTIGGFGNLVSDLIDKAIKGDPKDLVEAYFYLKAKDKVQTTIKAKGKNEGTTAVVDEIYNSSKSQKESSYESVDTNKQDENNPGGFR